MMVRFAGEDVPIKDLIARCLAANYMQLAGVADDGEADTTAERLLAVLDQLGCEIVKKTTAK